MRLNQYQTMLDAANKAYAAGNYAEAQRIASTAKLGLDSEAQQQSKLPFGLSYETLALIGIAIVILVVLAAGAFLLLKRGGKKKQEK